MWDDLDKTISLVVETTKSSVDWDQEQFEVRKWRWRVWTTTWRSITKRIAEVRCQLDICLLGWWGARSKVLEHSNRKEISHTSGGAWFWWEQAQSSSALMGKKAGYGGTDAGILTGTVMNYFWVLLLSKWNKVWKLSDSRKGSFRTLCQLANSLPMQ